MIPIADLVRMPKGTVQTYILDSGDESYFQKKLSTYCTRVGAKIEHNIWLCVRLKDNLVQNMVQCTVLKQGRKRKRKRKVK